MLFGDGVLLLLLIFRLIFGLSFKNASHSDLSKIKGVFGNKLENEDIKVLKLKPKEAFSLVKKGKINSVNTIIALDWLEKNMKNV